MAARLGRRLLLVHAVKAAHPQVNERHGSQCDDDRQDGSPVGQFQRRQAEHVEAGVHAEHGIGQSERPSGKREAPGVPGGSRQPAREHGEGDR